MKKILPALLLSVAVIATAGCSSLDSVLTKKDEKIASTVIKQRVGEIVRNGVTVAIPQDWKKDKKCGKKFLCYRAKDSSRKFTVDIVESDSKLTRYEKKLTPLETVAAEGQLFNLYSASNNTLVALRLTPSDFSETGFHLYRYTFKFDSSVDKAAAKAEFSEFIASTHWVTGAELNTQKQFEDTPRLQTK